MLRLNPFRKIVFTNCNVLRKGAFSVSVLPARMNKCTIKTFLNSFYSTNRSLNNSIETREFQAETRKLLDIVTHSIYTDKDVFIRELISNASDALEKLRYFNVLNGTGSSNDLEISIFVDTANNTLTIIDNGIGMSKDDLINNLGTIARSGSKQFVQNLQADGKPATDGIIGQFGVGFYSSFMVSDHVTVESITEQPTKDNEDGSVTPTLLEAHRWSSDGTGLFTIESIPVVTIPDKGDPPKLLTRGSKITMKISDKCKEYASVPKLKSIIEKYSSFVSFPIKLNGELINTVGAVWAMEKSSVTDEMYDGFYQFISNDYDKPRYRLHFRADAPIDLKCLLYVPSFQMEKFQMTRSPMGVSIYSKKVLIEKEPRDLLPDWLRFIKGAVDSEDLPLSLSREKPQDSNLLRRIRDVLTRKMIRFLQEEQDSDRAKYADFYNEFHLFIKEGAIREVELRDQVARLLMFESSFKKEGEVVTLDEYVSRCPPEQKNIFYLSAPNRQIALNSPYYEAFKKYNIEVLFLYHPMDEIVMSEVANFRGRALQSGQSSSVDLKKESATPSAESKEEETDPDAVSKDKKQLNEDESKFICKWLKDLLGSKKVKEVKVSNRLSDSPAIVTDHQSAALRKMMKMVEQANAGKTNLSLLPPQTLEINPSHPLIVSLYEIAKQAAEKSTEKSSETKSDEAGSASKLRSLDELGHEIGEPNKNVKQAHLSTLIGQQLFDNALMTAGLVDDPSYMVSRMNELLLVATTAQNFQKN